MSGACKGGGVVVCCLCVSTTHTSRSHILVLFSVVKAASEHGWLAESSCSVLATYLSKNVHKNCPGKLGVTKRYRVCMFFFHMFPSVLLYGSIVRVFSLVLDRQQTQTGARPCGQEEEDLVHCAAERHSGLGTIYALMWLFLTVCVVYCASAGSLRRVYNQIETE